METQIELTENPQQFSSLQERLTISKGNIIDRTNNIYSPRRCFDFLVHEIIEQMLQIKVGASGIDKWIAKMYLIFVLNRQDILPYKDLAFLQSYEWLYKTKESTEKKCKKWQPYSSIAARSLY